MLIWASFLMNLSCYLLVIFPLTLREIFSSFGAKCSNAVLATFVCYLVLSVQNLILYSFPAVTGKKDLMSPAN